VVFRDNYSRSTAGRSSSAARTRPHDVVLRNEDPLVWRRDFERMGDFAMNTWLSLLALL
jgi:hypothetical protein